MDNAEEIAKELNRGSTGFAAAEPPFEMPVWDHNVHFHQLLLGRCPPGAMHVLEVGCGHGLLSRRLAERVGSVDALDADASVLREAEKHVAGKNIRFICGDFLEVDLPAAHYDMITAVASLHHMDAHKALAKMKILLRPGGVLSILGLYRGRTLMDGVFATVSVPVDWFYLFRHRRVTSVEPHRTRPPDMTLAQIRTAAKLLLPGVVIRRHLLWRYSLFWQKPVVEKGAESGSPA